MEGLLNKHKTILYIFNTITQTFGTDYFLLSDFWNGDNCAIGLRKNEKLIYISTWNFRNYSKKDLRFYAEFELINPVTFETIKVEKILDNIDKDGLIYEIKKFVKMIKQ